MTGCIVQAVQKQQRAHSRGSCGHLFCVLVIGVSTRLYPLGPTLGTDSASCPRPDPVPTNAPSLSKLDTKLTRDEIRVDHPTRLLARPEKRDKNATFTQPGSDVAQTN